MFYRRVDFGAHKSSLKKLRIVYLWNQDTHVLAPLIESCAFSPDECLCNLIRGMVWHILNRLWELADCFRIICCWCCQVHTNSNSIKLSAQIINGQSGSSNSCTSCASRFFVPTTLAESGRVRVCSGATGSKFKIPLFTFVWVFSNSILSCCTLNPNGTFFF